MRLYTHKSLFFLFLLLFIFGSEVLAQTGTTSLRGVVVLDKSHGAISGAKVSISNSTQGLQRDAVTPSTGEFEFLALPPGTYTLTVEKEGFNKYEQANLQLLVNLPTTVNITLQIGSLTTQVEVSAQAMSSTPLTPHWA
jgi:carboxypeptidase family protein